MAKIVSTSTPRSFTVIEVIDILISDLLMNSGERRMTSTSNGSSKLDSMFYFIKARPNISLRDYMIRFQTHSQCSNDIILIGFIYFDRIIKKNLLKLNRVNIHKLLITSFLIATKYQEDISYDGAFYAKVCGLRVEDLKFLELEFLELIDYNLFVDEEFYGRLLVNLSALFNIVA